jgi:hypothetical protein
MIIINDELFQFYPIIGQKLNGFTKGTFYKQYIYNNFDFQANLPWNYL